tara:strand:- start:307 stop:1263 length:957 start_codon:yes stop_codon:yes gene_type:complete
MTVKKIHIKKISEIDKEKLEKFYQNSFQFEKTVLEDYNWRYRANFNEFEPLVLLIDNQLCGHAGLVPIKIKINEKEKNAIWFTDFFINPEHRSKGYGELLTEEWMKICPIQITFCNEQSLKVFKKFNWSSNSKVSRKIEFNNYLKILPIFRKPNQIKFNLDEIDDLKLMELNNATINEIINFNNNQLSAKSVNIVRDESWFKWRLLECPYKKKIYIFKLKEFFIITHIRFKNNLKILNILYSSLPITYEVKKIFLKFSKKNNIDYMAYLTNEKKLLDNFLPWQKKLNFAYYSKDETVKNLLEARFNDAQMIDSDIDYV